MVSCASTIGEILKLTSDEKSAVMSKSAGLWSAADFDSNHQLDMEESKLAAFSLSRCFAKVLFSLCDTDLDKGISRSEWQHIVQGIAQGLEEHARSRRRPPSSMLRALEDSWDHHQVRASV